MPPAEPSEPPKQKRPMPRFHFSKRLVPWIIIAILLVCTLFLLNQYNQARTKLNASGASSPEVAAITADLGKILLLPKDETPTVATVAKADELKSQAFFKDARNGDKVIVYSGQQRAILYRPSTGQIINVAPVSGTDTEGVNP